MLVNSKKLGTLVRLDVVPGCGVVPGPDDCVLCSGVNSEEGDMTRTGWAAGETSKVPRTATDYYSDDSVANEGRISYTLRRASNYCSHRNCLVVSYIRPELVTHELARLTSTANQFFMNDLRKLPGAMVDNSIQRWRR